VDHHLIKAVLAETIPGDLISSAKLMRLSSNDRFSILEQTGNSRFEAGRVNSLGKAVHNLAHRRAEVPRAAVVRIHSKLDKAISF